MDDEQEVLPCAEKITFDTQKDAQATATVTEHRYGTTLRPYRCRHCGLWHLASNF